MPRYLLILDVICAIVAVTGFTMAFRQNVARRILGRPAPCPTNVGEDDDPLTYILRIAGVMLMVFGVAIGIMVTLFHLS